LHAGIEFECPHCARVTRVPADLAGKQGRCAGCRKILEVPDPDLQGSARRTAHLRQEDRTAFELADSTTIDGRPPLPETSPAPPPRRPSSEMAQPGAWDRAQVPVWMMVAYLAGLLLPPLPLGLGFYGVVKGHLGRVRELAAFGWFGLVEFQVIWLLFAVVQFGVFLVPLFTIVISLVLGSLHVRWIAKHPLGLVTRR
jgi:hypothetical protein